MMPKAFIYVYNTVKTIVDHYAKRGYRLARPFIYSIWPAATWNFPPFAATFGHTDPGNGRCIPCSITSLGRFNADRSGHLILFDLGLVIRFPAGSTIHICSGGMLHGNTRIHPDDERASFIQYFAGGLKRHIDYGFKSEDWLSKNKRSFLRRVLGQADERAREAMALFSTPESLEEDRKLLMGERL
jgi:hypothetical protein